MIRERKKTKVNNSNSLITKMILTRIDLMNLTGRKWLNSIRMRLKCT